MSRASASATSGSTSCKRRWTPAVPSSCWWGATGPALDWRRDASGLQPLLRPARRRAAPADLSHPAWRGASGDAAGLSAVVPGDARGMGASRCPNGCSTTSASGRSSPTRQPPSRAARSSGSPPTASIRHTCSSVGRRRRWTRWPASSTSARATRRCAGWRSMATAAPASPR